MCIIIMRGTVYGNCKSTIEVDTSKCESVCVELSLIVRTSSLCNERKLFRLTISRKNKILLSRSSFKAHLERGFPVAARGEKDTSNSSSIPRMFSTKYLNFLLNILMAWSTTASKLALPVAMRFSCSSTAARIVGFTRSGSV